MAAFLSGTYARGVRESGAAIYREEPFVVVLSGASGQLYLRGTIDLLVAYPDGSADIIDYKTAAHAETDQAAFQLRAYAVAAARLYGRTSIRVGVLSLAAPSDSIGFTPLDTATLVAFEASLLEQRTEFLLARATDQFRGVARPRCESLRCGFIYACHDRTLRGALPLATSAE
jgi:RecB family exonuclease